MSYHSSPNLLLIPDSKSQHFINIYFKGLHWALLASWKQPSHWLSLLKQSSGALFRAWTSICNKAPSLDLIHQIPPSTSTCFVQKLLFQEHHPSLNKHSFFSLCHTCFHCQPLPASVYGTTPCLTPSSSCFSFFKCFYWFQRGRGRERGMETSMMGENP